MKSINLNGEWRLSPADSQATAQYQRYFTSHQSVPCQIPGDIHAALLQQQLIVDPYQDTCELDMQWVGKVDWLLTHGFTVTQEDLEAGRAILTLSSVDTFGTIIVNGVTVHQCVNQFRRWRIDITKQLHVGQNTITILFKSAENEAVSIASELPYPIPYSQYPVFSPHRNLVRKCQCHSGWDWGPCVMAFGIYDPISLDFLPTGYIDSVTTDTFPISESRWQAKVLLRYEAWQEGELPVKLWLKDQSIETVVSVRPGMNEIPLSIEVDAINPWWPAGQGKQHLYNMEVTAGDQQVSKKIGFRTMEVKTIEDANGGKGMTFCVNGRDIFAKGANWIPMDAIPSRMTRERYSQLLQDCVDANMNMIRVWGGGIYEKDCFYDLCDALGIMIWQDCMFGCSMYPAYDSFLDNVRHELAYQIRRLHDHPCIAIWCGNNEDLGAINWYEESRTNRDRYLIDYDRLNEGVVGDMVRKLDPHRAWWPSSPSAGPKDFSDNWHNDSRGDMHFWSVWHEGKAFDAYLSIRPRFVSEFGYQSFPSLSTVSTYAAEEEMNLTSAVMEHHQKNDRGNTIIIENFARYFRFPKDFENQLYLSQAQQALAMRTAIEYWRSLRPYCMGTLYWQLNDNWPVASWSSIDYTGKWKLLHYAAKRFYAPLMPVAYIKDGALQVYVLNDTESSYEDAKLSIKVSRFNGDKLPKQVQHISIEPQSSMHVCTVALKDIGAKPTEAFIYLKLRTTDVYVENTVLLEKPKHCALCNPMLDLQVTEAQGGFNISVSCKAPAFWVSLDAGETAGRFSDNFFDIRPTAPKQVMFRAKEPITLDEFKQRLKVYDLYSSGHEA